jgi:hypothetical protein
MSGNAYKLLGYAVWRGGKWYLRQRLPPRRTLVLYAAGTVAALSATALIARRLAS